MSIVFMGFEPAAELNNNNNNNNVLSACRVDEMNSLLADDDKLQQLLASRVDEVNDVQHKVVLFLEKFASKLSLFALLFTHVDVELSVTVCLFFMCVCLYGYGFLCRG